MTTMKDIIRTLARVINTCTIFDARIIVNARCHLYAGMRELETGKSGTEPCIINQLSFNNIILIYSTKMIGIYTET